MAVASVTHGGFAAHGTDEVDQLYVETRELRVQGFLLFMVSDLVLFSSFIFAYLYLRSSGQGWPPPGGPKLDLALASLNSGILFGSGATMHFALENWKHRNFLKFANWIVCTIVLGLLFLSGQIIEYVKIGVGWGTSGIFGAGFFTLTGMHGMHVFAGVIYLTVLLLQALAGKYTFQKYTGLTLGTLYWHFVDVIWVVLFSIFYLL
ncbi:MAG TPA: cytochrome c oxidase subunit 3 [Candidatus Baltobacteraceae bacterium]|jgi:cytochrome c oxidase subunit 3|nr:cytochrome c oxidase subunit 3 [Candidatus Baltobacteraceae bacterium]